MNETSPSKVKKSNKTFPQLVTNINEALLEKKAEHINVLDVRGITTLTDFFIVCNGGSESQIKALADNVSEKVKEATGEHVWRKEGLDSKKWVVLDYVDVVVHIFNRENREYYALEKMWNDAKVTTVED